MLLKNIYTKDYIQELHRRTGNDPALLEKMIYAFGLLEAITKVKLPFCFKGGTSLMLILEHPRRLSTDIDIIVEPGTDISSYIQRAGEIFPFTYVEEHIRIGKNNIEKRHFKFKYFSPCSNREVTILLDVVFEDLHYNKTIECPIRNELLLSDGDDLMVTIPDADGILGDKLTAFAPHTTGIPFGINKELEILKQLFDCSSLFDAMSDYKEVCACYNKTVKTELFYRGLRLSREAVLEDTIRGCLCIASRGKLYKEEYGFYKDGIFRIKNHIIGGRFNAEIAGAYAGRVLYLSSSMLSGSENITKIDNADKYSGQKIEIPESRSFSYLRVVDPVAYGYIVEAFKLLENRLQ